MHLFLYPRTGAIVDVLVGSELLGRDGDRDHDRRDYRNDRSGDRPRDGETSSRRDSDKRDDRKERPAQPKKIEEQKPPVSTSQLASMSQLQ